MTQIVLPITSRANTDPNLFSDVYSNDTAITTVVNGGLDNSNLADAGTANIAPGKLSAGSSGQLLVCSASGVPTYKSVTGDVTVTAGGVTAIGSSKVLTANIADGAATSRKVNPTCNTVQDAAANQTISSITQADVSGATFSITPAVASTIMVWATLHIQVIDASHSIAQGVRGYLVVDGTSKAAYATGYLEAGKATGSELDVTAGRSWTFALDTTAHTIKLQARLTTGAGTETAKVVGYDLSYILFAS